MELRKELGWLRSGSLGRVHRRVSIAMAEIPQPIIAKSLPISSANNIYYGNLTVVGM